MLKMLARLATTRGKFHDFPHLRMSAGANFRGLGAGLKKYITSTKNSQVKRKK